jgi:hypothetical protein
MTRFDDTTVMRLPAVLAALIVAAPLLLSAQGLATVAKQEEDRRKAIKAAGKVYTNDSLKPDITASIPPTSPSNTSASAPTEERALQPPAGETPPDGDAKTEEYWRSRMGAARSALERSRIFADALQSRLNALSTDIVNRDDPAQRQQLELERSRAQAEMDRVKKEMTQQEKAIAEIEEEARRAGVPPGWLR